MFRSEIYKRHLSDEAFERLKRHRFVIKPESMEGFKSLRSTFQEMQQQYPYLSGLGFFGSRTKGAEKKRSDYDTIAFYDSSKMTSGTMIVKDWMQIVNKLDRSLGRRTHIDQKMKPKLLDGSIGALKIDISETATNEDLAKFKESADPYIHRDIDDILGKVDGIHADHIMSRFHLSVGDDVYANRKYILDQLSTSQNGDKYFQILMRLLGEVERLFGSSSTPNFDRLPQTIDEARRYFITK